MSVVAFKLDPERDSFQKDFVAHGANLPGAGQHWLETRRARAMEAFGKTGVPNRRVEAWKYTDLASALEEQLTPATPSDAPPLEPSAFADIPAAQVTIVNGQVCELADEGQPLELFNLAQLDVNAPDWVKAGLGELAAGSDQPLGAASLALMRGGVAVRVTDDAVLRLEFENPALGYDWAAHSRVLIVVEEDASLKLLESHRGEGSDRGLANIGMEFVLKPAALVEHIRLQHEQGAGLHVTSLGAAVAEDARYRVLSLALGGKLSRLDANIRLTGKGAFAEMRSIAVLKDGVADTTTVMDHASPHSTSRQLFKSVVGGHARSVAQGRVTVREGAVKSDSHQLFKALLLSPRAEVDAKPELEIFADDVICGHGSAIGALEGEALFYLRARGIPEPEAKQLLIRAFLDEAMDGFGSDAILMTLTEHVDAALAGLGEAS